MLRAILTIAAVLWMGFVAFQALQSWPTIPLDMGGGGAQLEAAYNRAVTDHVMRAAVIALVPGALLLIVGWLIGRRKRATA